MNNNINKLTKTFIKKYKLTVIDYSSLKNTASNMGYTVIEFNSIFNEKRKIFTINAFGVKMKK